MTAAGRGRLGRTGPRCWRRPYRGCEVLVEVDSGHHRTGVAPRPRGRGRRGGARGGPAGRRASSPSRGTPTRPESAKRAAADEARRAVASRPTHCGRWGSSRGSAAAGRRRRPRCPTADVLTELRPGVYAFQDAQQAELGSTDLADVALTAVATVVSRGRDRAVLDAGSKVLGADRPAWATGLRPAARPSRRPGRRPVRAPRHGDLRRARHPRWGSRSGWRPTTSAPRSTSPTNSWSSTAASRSTGGGSRRAVPIRRTRTLSGSRARRSLGAPPPGRHRDLRVRLRHPRTDRVVPDGARGVPQVPDGRPARCTSPGRRRAECRSSSCGRRRRRSGRGWRPAPGPAMERVAAAGWTLPEVTPEPFDPAGLIMPAAGHSRVIGVRRPRGRAAGGTGRRTPGPTSRRWRPSPRP